jgi:hypothetical protein
MLLVRVFATKIDLRLGFAGPGQAAVNRVDSLNTTTKMALLYSPEADTERKTRES